MIPAAFDYIRAESVEEAVAALAERGEDAKVLAGGHSLLPLMKLRLAFPTALIDITRADGMRGVREEGDRLVIGAATPHAVVADDQLVAQHCGAIAEVTRTIGDPQVRNRGTHGGALAHGDPAGDLPAVAVALDARFTAAGPGGRRTIPAADFFEDVFTTALADDEVLVEVSWPKLTGWSHRYVKFARVAQAWAIVGALAVVRRDDGVVAEARVGLTNMGSRPVRAAGVEAAIAGVSSGDAPALQRAADQAAEGTSPSTDVHGDAEYRKHLARILTRRAVQAAAGG